MGLYSSRHIAASRGVAAAQFDRLLQNRHRPAAAAPRPCRPRRRRRAYAGGGAPARPRAAIAAVPHRGADRARVIRPARADSALSRPHVRAKVQHD
jgi:hypothetical protein